MKNSIGIDNMVVVRDARKATRRALFFSPSDAVTMPSIFFWFGQISTQTLNSMMVPSHAPIPIPPMPLRSRKASTSSGPSRAAPASQAICSVIFQRCHLNEFDVIQQADPLVACHEMEPANQNSNEKENLHCP